MKAGEAAPTGVQTKLGITDGIATEILAGLDEGQTVVTGIENPAPVAPPGGQRPPNNPLSGGGPRFR